jgi:transcriptional regulator EpsA
MLNSITPLPNLSPLPNLCSSLVNIIRQGLHVRRHVHLLHWLQGEVQTLLPHDVLIAAWGDFSLGLIQLDVVSADPAVRTRHVGEYDVMPMVRDLFDWWYDAGRRPATMDASNQKWLEEVSSSPDAADALRRMRSATVHGIKDERGRHDCLYIVLSSRPTSSPRLAEMLETLLPYIDTAMRQLPLLPAANRQGEDFSLIQPDTQLSDREMEIMDWVRLGKTNYEIGMILNISSFTVKNHMQRILRRLNVSNRAQAVSRVNQSLRQRPADRATLF